MKKVFAVGTLFVSLLYGGEPFSDWWQDARMVCVVGRYKTPTGEWKEFKPFCCRIDRVSSQTLKKGYTLNDIDIKEKLFVKADCSSELWGVIRHRGEFYLVNGGHAITNTTPNGFLKVEDGDKLSFKVCRGPAGFGTCEGGHYVEGYLLKNP